ncbi:hypothetical protein ACEPPN_019260 [Leptodophora sp. 'Broadleaf-Isolate-01']
MGSQQSLYSRLDTTTREIRLLHIQPGNWDDPILCEMQIVSLESSPVYQTLSYTWGDPQATKPILLEDCVVDIRTNLWAALRRLRCASKIRVIWIDALCINQHDVLERNQQVLLMGSIYSSCREVIMWLGDGLGENPVDTLTIEEDSYSSTPGAGSPERREMYDVYILIILLGRDTHFDALPYIQHDTDGEIPKVARFRKAWEALGAMMQLPYWSRIWTVQENILPPDATVVLGSIGMRWHYFSEASNALMKHSTTCCSSRMTQLLAETTNTTTLFNRIVSGLDQLRNFKYHDLPPPSPEALLHRFFDRKATDPRDKVYGILSLIEALTADIWKNRDERIVPDYSPANSTRKMFLHVTFFLFETTKSLEILTGHCRRRHEPNFPSWVVDWGQNPDVSKWDADRLRMLMYEHYNAGKNAPFVSEALSNERLKVHGMLIDDVLEVGPCMSSSKLDNFCPTLDAILRLGGKQRLSTDNYKSGGTWADAHWDTVHGDLFWEVDEFRKRKPEDGDGLEPMSVMGALTHRCVFVTKQGYLGLGPENMQRVDQVAILGGSNVPFILRAVGRNGTFKGQADHRLIGDCYVHGLMDGEVCETRWHSEARSLILH